VVAVAGVIYAFEHLPSVAAGSAVQQQRAVITQAPVQPSQPAEPPPPPPLSWDARHARAAAEFAETKKLQPALEDGREQTASDCSDWLDNLDNIEQRLSSREDSQAVREARDGVQCRCLTMGRAIAAQAGQAAAINSSEPSIIALQAAGEIATTADDRYKQTMRALEKSGAYLNSVQQHMKDVQEQDRKDIREQGRRGRT
jgi:small-conductance mechanosensitive channel